MFLELTGDILFNVALIKSHINFEEVTSEINNKELICWHVFIFIYCISL